VRGNTTQPLYLISDGKHTVILSVDTENYRCIMTTELSEKFSENPKLQSKISISICKDMGLMWVP
jgi:hypothetical protein